MRFMKVFILLAALSYSALTIGYDCQQNEAQFIGKAIEKSLTTENGCQVKIKFSYYRHHVLCPILLEEAYDKLIKTSPERCKEIEENDNVSGILIQDISNGQIFIKD